MEDEQQRLRLLQQKQVNHDDSNLLLQIPRKRIRVPNACTVCRKRKVRCDQVKPTCGECSRRSIPHLCTYPGIETEWNNYYVATQTGTEHEGSEVPPPSPKESPDRLLARITYLEEALAAASGTGLANEGHSGSLSSSSDHRGSDYNPQEQVLMHQGLPFLIPFLMRKKRFEVQGAFSPIYTLKTDIHLRIIWVHMWRFLDKAMQATASSLAPGVPGAMSSGPLDVMFVQFLELKRQKTALKSKQEAIKNDPDLETLILEHIPRRRVILSLIVRYEKLLYPLLPFGDKDLCMHEDIHRIFGAWKNLNDKPTSLDVSKKYDFAIIAVLYLVMAITVFSITDNELENHTDFKHLKNVNTSLYQTIAQRCLAKYDNMRKNYSTRVLHAHLLLLYYYKFCPEDDCVSDFTHGRNMLGFVISMARSRGMHAEPIQLGASLKKEVKSFNVWRSIWHTLMDLDATSAMNHGLIPRFEDDSSYDTALPEPFPGMDDAEKQFTGDFVLIEKKVRLYRAITTQLLQRGLPPIISQVMSAIKQLEHFADFELMPLDQILSRDPVPVSRLKKVIMLFEVENAILWLKVKLLNHFQQARNVKMITVLFFDVIRLATRYHNSALNTFYNADLYFGSAYIFFLRTSFVYPLIKVILMFVSLFSRCLQTLKLTPLSEQVRIGKIKEMQTAILVNMGRMDQLFKKMNAGYYNAQRSTLALSYFLKILKDPSFDFDKASVSVTDLSVPGIAGLPHELHGAKPQELPDTNFLMNLVDAELDQLKNILHSDIADVLHPLIGPTTRSIPSKQLFKPGGASRIYHFDPVERGAALATQREYVEANVSSISKQYQFDKLLQALPDENPSTEGKTPQELERELLQTVDGQDPHVTLSSDELSDLLGLLEGFNYVPNGDGTSDFADFVSGIPG